MIKEYFNTFWAKYHQLRGVKMLHRNQMSKAYKHLEKSLIYKDYTETYFYFAIALIGQEKHKSAIPYLQKILDKHPDERIALSSLAECYLVTRQWDKSEDILSYLKQKSPNNATIQKLYKICIDPVLREKYVQGKELFYSASDELDKKNYDIAYEKCLKAIELEDDNPAYYYLAGLILMSAKKPKAEIEPFCEKAVNLAPKNLAYKQQLQFLKTKYKK